MKEKIEKLDFNTMDENASNELLNEVLNLDGEAQNEAILAIVDNMPYDTTSEDVFPISYSIIFKNETIAKLIDTILESY